MENGTLHGNGCIYKVKGTKGAALGSDVGACSAVVQECDRKMACKDTSDVSNYRGGRTRLFVHGLMLIYERRHDLMLIHER